MITLTPEQRMMRDSLSHSTRADARVTEFLRLKLLGYKHREIAEQMNMTLAAVNILSSRIKRV
ncbi:hypothetical protein WP8S18E06_24770 [Klebsiella sp. WP8-S18-ESBL-06]|nr:hypothetical protein WP4W18E05_27100 [Klebsiella sp. WP4-W18-ESBL-05]BBT71178.1 hypothetical protein WP8S18E06_24770 [Klebsiella sp. WP8-S18-ESBL-06]